MALTKCKKNLYMVVSKEGNRVKRERREIRDQGAEVRGG
jgi:hypothetical protein